MRQSQHSQPASARPENPAHNSPAGPGNNHHSMSADAHPPTPPRADLDPGTDLDSGPDSNPGTDSNPGADADLGTNQGAKPKQTHVTNKKPDHQHTQANTDR